MKKTDNLDILSSIWILASNDENCFITYKSVKHRLGLDENFDVEKLITLHGELFRLKAQKNAVEDWKAKMLKGKHLPSWIKAITDINQQTDIINKLTENDIFRSQFRAEINAKPSNIEIINWGLEHIERIRRISLEKKEENYKKFTSFWIPILSTFISFVALISSYLIQQNVIKNQNDLKKTELEYKTKQDGYTSLMKNLTNSYINIDKNDKDKLQNYLDNIETSFYNIENLMNKKDADEVWKEYQSFTNFCYKNLDKKMPEKMFVDSCLTYKYSMKTKLQKSLFTNK